ncbi:MAG: DsbC family protein [Syntrophorhabdaceae bacterium]|nr:DsbC family protein [Syntrophorhabdaceae bacterium]
MKVTLRVFILLMTTLMLIPVFAVAFDKNDSSAKPCAACHAITREEVAAMVGVGADNVAEIVPGPVRGIWEMRVSVDGKIYPIYVDYSKKYILQGNIIRLSDKENLTLKSMEELNRVDVSSISLKNAIVLGKESSNRKIIVLTDPSCAYCIKLHESIKEAVGKDPEVAFYVMPYPRNSSNKELYDKCLAAICDKSGKILDDIYAGKEAPPAICKSDAVDENIRLAGRLKIPGTPSMVLPDGRVISGFRSADELLRLTK